MDDIDKDADPDGLAFELYLAMSANPSRRAVSAVWSAIVEGRAGRDTKDQWLDHIAKYVHRELIETYDPDDPHRGSKALRALGLFGKVDEKYVDDRSFMTDLYLFANAEGRDIKITPAFVMKCRYPEFQGNRRSLHKRLGEVIRQAKEDAEIAMARLAKIKNDPDIIEMIGLVESSLPTESKNR